MISKPEMCVALRLRGKRFAPEDVTRVVGLSPSKTWRAGEPIPATTAKRKDDRWEFGLSYRETFDMEEMLKELLDTIEPYRERITAAAKEFGLVREISFGVYIREQTPACWFSADTMRRLADLGADLDIDLILTK